MRKLQRKIIIPTWENACWLDGRVKAASRGGLPSTVLHDDILVKLWPILSASEKEKLKRYYPGWAKEVLVYPEKGGVFKRGKDIVDEYIDNLGRSWVFVSSDIPEQALKKRRVGLLVDPEDTSLENYKGRSSIIIHPKAISVVEGLVEISGSSGIVHEETRLPLEVPPKVLKTLPAEQKRCLWRADGPGVRPIIHVICDCIVGRTYVGAGSKPDKTFGVAYVSLGKVAVPKMHLESAPGNTGVIVKDLSLGALTAIVTTASSDLSVVLPTVNPDRVVAIAALLKMLRNALEIKD